MSEESKNTPFIVELLRAFAVTFSPAVLVMSFVVTLVVRYAPNAGKMSSLFSQETGLSFGSILQIAGMSLVFAVFSVLFISERFLPAMRFLYRLLFFFLAALLAVSAFAVIFKWIPVNNLFSWITFISSFVICYVVSVGLTLLWLRREKKKYGRLLADYKARREGAISPLPRRAGDGTP